MKYIQARPTMYAGILMRSRLEASFAQELDRRHWNWEYEPLCFAGPSGQYLPDFRILFDDRPGSGIYVEVKPTVELAWDARTRMLPIRDTYPTALLAVVAPSGERFGCYGTLRNESWEPGEGYWPDLPSRIPGPCQCGNEWIDPEFGRCEYCWRFLCFACRQPLPSPGLDHVGVIVGRDECDVCGSGSLSDGLRLCGRCTSLVALFHGDISQARYELVDDSDMDPGPGPDHCRSCWERIRLECQ